MKRYLIAGPARSGTTVTHLCLAGHPNVSALSDEVKVRPFFTEGISAFTHGNDKEEERRQGFVALFDALSMLHRPPQLLACGLKTAISCRDEAMELVRSLQTYFPELKIILTLRNDIVAQFGSLERAKATGKWHSWVKSDNGSAGRLQIDDQRLYAHAADYLQTVRELQRLKETHDVFEVFYEDDILPGDLRVYSRLFDFLDLPQTEITWLKSKKVAPAPEQFIDDYRRHADAVLLLLRKFEADPALFEAEAGQRVKRTGIWRRLRHRFFPSGCEKP